MKKVTTASNGNEPMFFYGYVIVLVSFVLQTVGWGMFNSFGVFFTPIIEEFAWPRAVIASAVSLSMFIFGIAGIVQGRLSDRFGPRMIMTAGGCLLAAAYILLSQVSAVWHLYVFCSLLIGLGISGTDVVLLSTTARWFVKKRGMMTGIIKMGAGVGMLIMPLVINRLITAYGWRTAFVVLGVVVLFFYVLCSQFLVRDPGKIGRAPDGGYNAHPHNQPPPEGGMVLQEAARTVQFWTICFAYLLVFFCVSIILMHIVTHAIDLGIAPADAAKVLAGVGGASIAGRFVMGGAGDTIGNKSALVICFLFLGSSMVWLQYADQLWMLLLFALAYGFAHGGFYALIAPLIADLFGTRSHGVIFGIVGCVSTAGGASGPFVAGYLFDITGSYGTVFWILTAMSIAGLIAALTLKPITSNRTARRL